MHEMGIALEVYRVCRETAAANGGGRIVAVRMQVGELAAVEPDLLRFAWQAVTVDGPDAGAALEVTWCPAAQRCDRCGDVHRPGAGSWLRLCPECGSPLAVRGGDQLDLTEVVLEQDDGPSAPGDTEAP